MLAPAKRIPMMDVSETLRTIDRLHQMNKTHEAQILTKKLQRINPDFFANTTSLTTATADVATLSTTYQHLGCDLVAATNHHNSTTYLTFRKLEDGLGNFVIQLIKAMAFTYYKGWNFLGVQGKLKVSFGNHEGDVLNFYFGNYVPLLTSRSSFPNNTKVRRIGSKISETSVIMTAKSKKNTIYNLDTSRFELEWYIDKKARTTLPDDTLRNKFVINKTNEYISPEFLAHLRGNALCGVRKALSIVKRGEIDQEPSTAIKVVAHIRIGDVSLNPKFAYKSTPLQYYPLIFSVIQKICPLCKLYAFTSVQHDAQLRSILPFKKSLKRTHNVTLYIDKEFSKSSTDEALNTIAHFSTADVFITAKSEFSMVSAYLNPNCIIYTTYAANFPLHDWMVLPFVPPGHELRQSYISDMMSMIESNLTHCLEKKFSHKKLVS
jgi:hypothetical protein